MTFIRNILLLSGICLLNASVVWAQNGAIVEKGNVPDTWFDYDGDLTLAVQSSDPDFLCGDGSSELMLMKFINVLHPDGGQSWKEHGNAHARVFYPASPSDFVVGEDIDWEAYCELIADETLWAAEGIVRFNYTDRWGNEHGAARAGYTVTGVLHDLLGRCDGEMIELKTIWHAVWRQNKDPKEMYTPPTLSCLE